MNHRWRVSVLVCALILWIPALASAGLVLEQTTRGEGEGNTMMNGKSRVWASDQGSKVEMLELAMENPMFKPGSYILMRSGDQQAMIIVHPASKTWLRFDMGQMASMGAQMANRQEEAMRTSSQGDMRPRISDPKVEKLVDEAGEAMLGYPTRHYKFHIAYTTTQPMGGGIEMSMATDSFEEVWTTEALGEAGAAKLLNAGGGPGSSELSKLGEAAAAVQVPGVPLKRITTSTTKAGGSGRGMGMMSKMMNKGGPKTSKTVVEVTKIEKKDLPASFFKVPAGYTETDMFGGESTMPDLNDPPGP